MPTFQFKDPKYVLSPPQQGTKAIVNDLTVDASYKQVIDDLPVTSSTNLESIDFRAVAVLTLLISVNSTGDISEGFLRLLDVELDGTKALDIGDTGAVTAATAGVWLSFSRNTSTRTLKEKQHAEKFVKYLEQFYEEYKDESVTYQGAVYKIYLSEPKNNAGTFDSQRHYIVADASERVDRLKLVKYESKPNFSHSYWFDAGTGTETEGLDSLDFVGSKTANSSKITGKKLKFDGSDSSIVNVGSNAFDIEDHGFVTGDTVHYFKDIYLNFDSSDTSVVSVANNTITLADHGFRTGDGIKYIVKPGDVPIAPFVEGSSQVRVERVDDDTFKLTDREDNVIDITGLGSGIHSFSVASVQFTSEPYRHRNTFKVIRQSDDQFKLSLDGVSVLGIDAVGVGTDHCFQAGYDTTLSENQFIAVSESVNFSGSASGVNTTTNIITTTGAHGYTTGDTTVYTRGGSASIGGLVHKRLYYVIVESSTTLKLAASAKDAEDGTAVSLTAVDPAGEPDHKLTIEYGTKVYRINGETIYTTTSDGVVFTNRTLKTPNWNLDPKADIMVAKVYKYQSGATIKTTEAVATTTHNLKNITGERFRVGSTITQGINGNPKILSAVFTENADLGEDALITIDSAQTAAIDDAVVIESFAQEAYYNLESGDRLEEDDAPKLSAQLDLNSQSISDGSVAVSSFVDAAAGVANNDNDTSIPTTAAVKAYADSVAGGGGTVDTSGTPAADQYARFTDADTLQGRTAAQVLADIGAQASLTFGIADNNAVEIDDADVADNDYAKFTANGLEGRSASEVKTDLALNNVTNESKSTMFTNPAFTGTTTVEQLTGDVPTLASATQNAGSSGTVMNQTILNSSVENGSLSMLNTINELAGFDKWGTIQNVSNFYQTRTGSPGSYAYSTAIAADNAGWERAFDGTSGTAGSWFMDDGASGTDFTSNKATFELHFNSVKSLAYTCYAGIVFGSGSFVPSQLKIEAYTGGAYHTLCDLTNNTEVVVARRVNNTGSNGLERLRFTMNGNPTSGNGYIRIQEIFAVDHDAGNNSTRHKGRYFMSKYMDDYHFGDLFPGTDSTYDLGSATYAYAETHTDKLFLHDTAGTSSSALGLVLDGNEIKTRGLGSNAYLSKNYGIADDNAVEIDDTDAASGNYARFTANGIEGRTTSEVATDIGAMSTAVDNTMATDKKIQFRDTDSFINSPGTGQLTIKTGGLVAETPTFTVKANQDSSQSSPLVALNKNDATPVANNPLGRLQWSTDNSDDTLVDFAYLEAKSDVVTNGSEEGSVSFNVRNGAGTISEIHKTDKTGIVIDTDKKIQFRDTGSYINSPAANNLDLVADSKVKIDTPTLRIQTTTTADSAAPVINIDKVDSSPVDGAALGSINFLGNSSTEASHSYAQITSTTDDVTQGDTDGSLLVRTVSGGTMSTITTTNKDGVLLDTDKAVEFRSDAQYIKSDVAGSLQIGGASTTIKADTLTVESDQSGASSGATLILENDHDGTPGDNDLIAEIIFKGMDNSPAVQEFARIEADSVDVSNTNRDGAIKFFAHVNGTKTEHMKITGGKVEVTNTRLQFQDDAVDTSRSDTPNIGFELVSGSHGNHTHSSVLVLDDRTYLNAYGLMLADNQGTGSFSTTSSRNLATYSGGTYRLYSNLLYSRTSTVYFVNLYTTGIGLNLRGSARFYDNRYVGFGNSYDTKLFYDGTNNEMEMELESACTQFKITDNGTTRFTFTKSSGDFTATGNVTAYSDERLKSDIKTLDPSKTLQMRGVEFTKDGKKGSGVIAQELEKIAPELVLNEGEYKSVAYGNLTGYLIETIKDQQKQIDELKAMVEKLMEKV